MAVHKHKIRNRLHYIHLLYAGDVYVAKLHARGIIRGEVVKRGIAGTAVSSLPICELVKFRLCFYILNTIQYTESNVGIIRVENIR